LAPEGLQQAKELGIYYKSLHTASPINRILSSPLIRTLQTATAIADELNIKIWFVSYFLIFIFFLSFLSFFLFFLSFFLFLFFL
jgi:broad specificity phosphatase PhoE